MCWNQLELLAQRFTPIRPLIDLIYRVYRVPGVRYILLTHVFKVLICFYTGTGVTFSFVYHTATREVAMPNTAFFLSIWNGLDRTVVGKPRGPEELHVQPASRAPFM
jgi:hypothetical protein